MRHASVARVSNIKLFLFTSLVLLHGSVPEGEIRRGRSSTQMARIHHPAIALPHQKRVIGCLRRYDRFSGEKGNWHHLFPRLQFMYVTRTYDSYHTYGSHDPFGAGCSIPDIQRTPPVSRTSVYHAVRSLRIGRTVSGQRGTTFPPCAEETTIHLV